MIEPLSAAALGGFTIDKARSETSKWVGTRIKAHVELAGRNRELNQSRPAEVQQTESNAVLTHAADLSALELFPGEERLGAARAVMAHYKPRVSPNCNGWSFWVLDDGSGKHLQCIRGAS